MLENGLLGGDETAGGTPSADRHCRAAIGYKELLGYLNGEQTLEECTEFAQAAAEIMQNVSLLMKRDDSIHWIYYNSGEELLCLDRKRQKYLQNHGVQ